MPVLDDTAAGTISATVSFRITWRSTGPKRRLGHPRTAAPSDPGAFLGRLARARATGSFSGSSATGFTFQSDTLPKVKSLFAEIGTERNGSFLRPAAASVLADPFTRGFAGLLPRLGAERPCEGTPRLAGTSASVRR